MTIIQNNCLRRIFEIYKTIFITKLKTKTHILFINIYLNELQIKVKQKFQSLKYYKRIKKNKKKIIKRLKKKEINIKKQNIFRNFEKKFD